MKKLYPYYYVILFCFMLLIACVQSSQKDRHYHLITGWGMYPTTALPLDSIPLSDPFILADDATRTYYLTGTGGLLWKSKDLRMWEGPYSYIEIDTTSWMGSCPMVWAPELHKYRDKYYCLATFTNTKLIVDTLPGRYDVQRRAVHILVSDRPDGPYHPMNENIYLPEKWSTLDGTFWEEDGQPYLVFSHDWMQTVDGMVKCIALSKDMSRSLGIPITLFKASDAPWPKEMQSIGELTYGMSLNGYVLDGPFLFRTKTNRLGMLWSSWSDQRYAQGLAYSMSGKLAGPWIQVKTPLVLENSGHGMLFQTFEGKLLMSMHTQRLNENQEVSGPRYPVLIEVDVSTDELMIKE